MEVRKGNSRCNKKKSKRRNMDQGKGKQGGRFLGVGGITI